MDFFIGKQPKQHIVVGAVCLDLVVHVTTQLRFWGWTSVRGVDILRTFSVFIITSEVIGHPEMSSREICARAVPLGVASGYYQPRQAWLPVRISANPIT